jgi:hypothetical protein
MAKPPPNKPQGPQPPFITVLTLSGPLRIPNPNYVPKRKRPQRDPIKEWLDIHHPGDAWKLIKDKDLFAELKDAGFAEVSRSTLSRLRGET